MKGQTITDDKESVQLNLARLKKGGENFEISIIPDMAAKFLEGEDISISEVIESENIFADVQKGALASEVHMETVFGTKDPLKIAEINDSACISFLVSFI